MRCAGLIALFSFLLACDVEPQKTDAELGLTPIQSAGRRIFERQCSECHFAYISRALKGPSLQGLFKRPYMKNGMPANDERVREIIVYGRAKMPAYGQKLASEQIDRLMEYLHTL